MVEFENTLKVKLKNHHLDVSKEQCQKIKTYYRELITWNKKMNLTRITETTDFIIKHVIDSLMVEKLIDVNHNAKIVDIGTGPGIPGIILSIKRPDLKMGLLESQKKKTSFLTYIKTNLKLPIKILQGRAERMGKDNRFRENFDVAVARAVASLNQLLELSLPFVSLGGIFVAMKSDDIKDELQSSHDAFEVLGGKLENIIDYTIGKDICRKLVVVRKVKNTPQKYPRRPNAIKNNPL